MASVFGLALESRSLEIVSSIERLREIVGEAERNGEIIGFIPTMGYLHAGHVSLMDRARRDCDLVITSIFVNPTQFGVGEDLDCYPRDLEGDCEKAAEAGVDVIFVPPVQAMYPFGLNAEQAWVEVGGLGENLCGRQRPTHFRGVTTVVSKLFNLVRPNIAYFGQKDYQQLAIVRRMTEELCYPIEIVGLPTVREVDGLAMSSRNAYLGAPERFQAKQLVESLRATWDAYGRGEREVSRLLEVARESLNHAELGAVQYIELVDGDTLSTEDGQVGPNPVLAVAVRFGTTRLIDNVVLSGPRP